MFIVTKLTSNLWFDDVDKARSLNFIFIDEHERGKDSRIVIEE